MTAPTGKPLGRPPGSKNANSKDKDDLKSFTEGMKEAFQKAKEHLSIEQIRAMKPLEVLDFARVFYFENDMLPAAVSIAKEMAPYIHARRAPVADTAEDNTVKVVGGLPDEDK